MTGPIDLAQTTTPPTTIKFLCSYGGKIVPRHSDGKLRYNGGHTRVLAVDRSISFSELLVKLMEMSGTSISLRCQLPNEDMDALISITTDEDLANLIEEYDHYYVSSNSSLKIRAFLYPPKSIKNVSPTPSIAPPSSINYAFKFPPKSAIRRPCLHQVGNSPNMCYEKGVGKLSRYACHGHRNAGHVYLIHHGNHWQ